RVNDFTVFDVEACRVVLELALRKDRLISPGEEENHFPPIAGSVISVVLMRKETALGRCVVKQKQVGTELSFPGLQNPVLELGFLLCLAFGDQHTFIDVVLQ